MEGVMLALLALAGGGDELAGRLAISAHVAEFRQLAEPLLRSAPDTAEGLALKGRLVELLDWEDRASARLIRGEHIDSQDHFNLLQVTRDITDAGAQLAHFCDPDPYGIDLAWFVAGLKLSQALRVVYLRSHGGKPPKPPPGQLDQSRAQIELMQSSVNRTLGLYIATRLPLW